jgi:hypothetical protein
MSSNRNVQVTIRQYLLGQLTGDSLEQFEEQLFADDNLFEEILVAEDELIDESIAGELNQNDSDLFAKSFLNTPERKQKLLFRQVLKGYVDKKSSSRSVANERWAFWPATIHSFRTALASAAVIVVVALVGLGPLVRHWTMQPASFATINLTISPSERAPGAQIPKVKLPLGVDELRLQLTLPENSAKAQSYRVELVKASGEKRTIETIAREEKSIVVAISASQLEPSQYALNLYAAKPDEAEQRIAGSYYFTAE